MAAQPRSTAAAQPLTCGEQNENNDLRKRRCAAKSTVATLLSKRMNEMDYQVLLVDADESNLGVGRLMGASDPEALMDGLGGKKDLQQKMMASYTQGTPLKLFEGKWAISDIPENCLADADGIKYMAIAQNPPF